MELDQDFQFLDPNGLEWSVPSGVQVDGASIPRVFWTFIGGPFSGAYTEASVIHDYYCCARSRTAHDTHRNFYYGMRANGVVAWKAKFMLWAVSTFGPQWRLNEESTSGSHILCPAVFRDECCEDYSQNADRVGDVESIDFENEYIAGLALAKAAAVARTLKTSNGMTLDVIRSGSVGGSIEDIADSADQYRRLFSSGDIFANLGQLGLMYYSFDSVELDSIVNWEGNEIPSLSEIPYLRQIEDLPQGSEITFQLEASAILENDIIGEIGSRPIG